MIEMRKGMGYHMEKAKIHESAFIAEGAVVLGNITVGEESSIWYHTTVRAEGESITIGKRSNIQDNAVVHVDAGFPVHIGDNVTIGHGAIIHGSIIEDNTLIGMGAIILNGARVGRNCIIGAGALVTQNVMIPDNSLVVGNPGKIMRKVTEEEKQSNIHNASVYVEESKNNQ